MNGSFRPGIQQIFKLFGFANRTAPGPGSASEPRQIHHGERHPDATQKSQENSWLFSETGDIKAINKI
jgi:hypothetical protein